MRKTLGMWSCECCGLSNPNEFDRCSYCGLPAFHTSQELEKYKRGLPRIKSKDQNIWIALGSTFLELLFTRRYTGYNRPFGWFSPLGLLLLIGLLMITPFIKDHIEIVMLVALFLSSFIGLYFYMKK